MKLNNNNESNTVDTWKGLTIDELKYARASSLIRLEMQKEYLKRKVATTAPILSGNKSNSVKGAASKMTAIQKILLVVKGVRMAKNMISLIKKSK